MPSAQSMRRRRFVLISPFFFPEPISTGRYNTHLARALAARGHDVRVYCSHPIYPDWTPQPSSATLDGVRISRGGLRMRYPARPILRRGLLESWFALFVAAQDIEDRPDNIVVAIVPPSLFVVPFAARFRRAATIAIVHDLQHVHASASGTATAARAIAMLEGWAFRRLDRTVFLSEAMQRRACLEYRLDPARTGIAYPFPTMSVRPKGFESSAKLADVMPASHRHVVYSGALGSKQDPELLFRFFCAAASRFPDVRFHIFSRGDNFRTLRARNGSDRRVLFHDLVADDSLAELYERSTIQIIPQARGTSDGSIPSKLPNLLLSGTPILAVCDAGSELETIQKEVTNMRCVQGWDFGQLLQCLETLLTVNRIRNSKALGRFSIEHLVRILENE